MKERLSSSKRITSQITEGPLDWLKTIKDDAMETQGTGGDHILQFVVNKNSLTGVNSCACEDVPVKAKVGLPFPRTPRCENLIKDRPVRRLRSQNGPIGRRDVGHGKYTETALGLSFELTNEVNERIISDERLSRLVKCASNLF